MYLRKKIQENIFDLTQVGCMKKLTDAIIIDVKNTLERNGNLEYEEAKLTNEVKYINGKLGEANFKMAEIHAKSTQLETSLSTGLRQS